MAAWFSSSPLSAVPAPSARPGVRERGGGGRPTVSSAVGPPPLLPSAHAHASWSRASWLGPANVCPRRAPACCIFVLVTVAHRDPRLCRGCRACLLSFVMFFLSFRRPRDVLGACCVTRERARFSGGERRCDVSGNGRAASVCAPDGASAVGPAPWSLGWPTDGEAGRSALRWGCSTEARENTTLDRAGTAIVTGQRQQAHALCKETMTMYSTNKPSWNSRQPSTQHRPTGALHPRLSRCWLRLPPFPWPRASASASASA